MPLFSKPKPKRKNRDSLPKRNSSGRAASKEENSNFLETSPIIESGLLFFFAALIIIICFLGQKPKGPRIILNQPAATRIVAEFNFDYTSKVQAEERARAVRAQVPPVFERSYTPYQEFEDFINALTTSIAKTQIEFEAEGQEILTAKLEETATALIETHGLSMDPELITKFTGQLTPRERSSLILDALSVLKALYEDGIYSAQSTNMATPQVTVIQLVDEEGRYNLPNARSFTDAVIALRVRINALSGDKETARTLFDIFRSGIEANLLYSAVGTQRATERAVAQIEPKVITYKLGDTIIAPGAIITELDIERLKAYREAEQERGNNSLIFNQLFIERLALTCVLLISVIVYVRQGLRDIDKRNRAIAITAISVLLNLLIIRLIVEIGEITLINDRPGLSMFPYTAPYALAPIIVAVLVGTSPAVLSALIISVLFGIVQGNSIEFMLIAFLSGVVGSYVSANIRKRSELVRAGLIAGATAAIAGAAIGFINGFTFGLVGQQTLIALIVGALTGIVAAGILPVYEQLFKITTEITLLELTDFNHPLLRRMQMEAPGTYHHSLMVANLAENAAAEIGASPLLCRVCCFFHDIGKLVKPEYFTENQRDGVNPHDTQNPSMSALVIKAHVKEGVELAHKFKLPRVIIDVIRQHHGTTLIQYFYYQAQQDLKKLTVAPPPTKSGKQQEEKKVDESTYRYDGPRPRFKESAIIFFADSVEAASRTLKKVSQPAVEELIDSIFKDRIEDGQLDECPLTFHELALIRRSFTYTVLNMLHVRIEYPKGDKDKKSADKTAAEYTQDNANDQSRSQQPV
ncbi:MAG: HD family phosphohydrolase [Opitutaceae bacterium]